MLLRELTSERVHSVRLETVVGGRQRERGEGEHHLAGHGQGLPSGRQDGESGA